MDLMRRSRRPRLSDEQAERLLSGDDAPVAAAPLSALTSRLREAGRTPPSDAVAGRHLAAIVAEVRDTRHGDAAPAPAPREVRRAGAAVLRGLLVPRRLTAAAAAFTAVIALAISGTLPGPVQAAAADLLAVVGIAVPDGRSTSQPRDDAPAPRVERRERSLPRSPQAPAVTGAPRHGTQEDRRDRPRRTRSAGTDAGDRRPADDRRDDRAGGSGDDETDAIDEDKRRSGPDTDAGTDSGEDTDDPSAEDPGAPPGAGPIDAGDTDSLEDDRADPAEPRSADETPREGD